MILVISPYITNRLKYVIDFINSCYPKIHIELSTTPENEGVLDNKLIIEYSKKQLIKTSLFIEANGLLESDKIIKIDPQWNNTMSTLEAFLNSSHFGYDIFSSIFYQLSRYEEYIASPLDKYGRFDSQKSTPVIAGKGSTPLVDLTVKMFLEACKKINSALNIETKEYTRQATMDIDIAYDYLGRKFIRSMGALIRDIASPNKLAQRMRVLLGLKKDPAYIFDLLTKLNIIYFIHVGTYGPLDKNSGLSKKQFQAFLQKLPEDKMGIHPSFQSHLDLNELLFEMEQLEVISDQSITQSRQHYIKMILPDTYELLSDIGITKDYSMGWPDIPGYRAGTTHPHFFYNLKTNQQSSLELYPFVWMDAHFIFGNTKEDMKNSFHQHQSIAQAYGGHFTPIFHNNHFSTNPQLWELIEGLL